jgi:hypothetical protein
VIESLHATDYVKCRCDAIAIDGGPDNYLCYAKDWANFLRVDENGNEIKIKVKNEQNNVKDDHKIRNSDAIFNNGNDSGLVNVHSDKDVRLDKKADIRVPDLDIGSNISNKRSELDDIERAKKSMNDDSKPPSKEELLYMLDEMIKSFQSLPQHAMLTPINHYDFSSLMLLVSALFKAS